MRVLIGYAIHNSAFDIREIERLCRENGKELSVSIDDILDISMRDSLADLVLHLFYMGEAGYNPDKMTAKDHIFPDSKLKRIRENGRLKYHQDARDRILNCELLDPQDNLTKGDSLPERYLAQCNDDYLRLHGIPSNANIWTMDSYDQFLEERRAILAVRLGQNLQGLLS